VYHSAAELPFTAQFISLTMTKQHFSVILGWTVIQVTELYLLTLVGNFGFFSMVVVVVVSNVYLSY
jgi:hypothetical protein